MKSTIFLSFGQAQGQGVMVNANGQKILYCETFKLP